MPRKMVRSKRKTRHSLTDKRLHFLKTGAVSDKFTTLYAIKRPTLADIWRRHGADIVREHIRRSPCSRPTGWWYFDAPKEYRKLIAGEAGGECGPTRPDTPCWLRFPDFEWIHSNNPPQVESDATFLQRHGQLSPRELAHLKKHPELFEPIILRAFDPGYPYDWQKGGKK